MAVRTPEEGRPSSEGYVTIEEFLRWKKEFQEYKAMYEEREAQREKLIEPLVCPICGAEFETEEMMIK